MAKKNHFYLGEENIEIEAPDELLGRINRNFEEEPSFKGDIGGWIRITEGDYVEFSRDRSKPYLSKRPNDTKPFQGTDFLRYGVHVRTIWQVNPVNYEIQNFQPLDESGAISCFKKIYYARPAAQDKALLHASLVSLRGRGLLVTGECWSGKTSLTLGFLEQLGATLVSDGNVLVSQKGGQLFGHYLPRPIFIRFHSLRDSSTNLPRLLTDPSYAEAVQPFDKEAIEEITTKEDYDIDGGLNVSRKRFGELVGISTIPSHRIHKIVHTSFDSSTSPKVFPVGEERSYELLAKREFPKETSVGNLQHQRDINSPQIPVVTKGWVEDVERVGVSFDAKKNLTINLLEEIV